MAKVTIINEDTEFTIEGDLIPATEQELKAIVKKAMKGVGKEISQDALSELIPAINAEIQKIRNDAESYVLGLKPADGKDYVMTDQDLVYIIESVLDQLPEPTDGVDGKDGRDGVDGKDGEFTEEIRDELALSVESQLAPMIIEETSPEVLRNKLESLEGDNRLDASAIKNLPEATERIVNAGGSRGLDIGNGSGDFFRATKLTLEGATISVDGRHVTLSNIAGGGSGGLEVTESDLTDPVYYYYGGIDTSGDWKINRYDRDDATLKNFATEANNPGIINLGTAWSSRTLLNYS